MNNGYNGRKNSRKARLKRNIIITFVLFFIINTFFSRFNLDKFFEYSLIELSILAVILVLFMIIASFPKNVGNKNVSENSTEKFDGLSLPKSHSSYVDDNEADIYNPDNDLYLRRNIREECSKASQTDIQTVNPSKKTLDWLLDDPATSSRSVPYFRKYSQSTYYEKPVEQKSPDIQPEKAFNSKINVSSTNTNHTYKTDETPVKKFQGTIDSISYASSYKKTKPVEAQTSTVKFQPSTPYRSPFEPIKTNTTSALFNLSTKEVSSDKTESPSNDDLTNLPLPKEEDTTPVAVSTSEINSTPMLIIHENDKEHDNDLSSSYDLVIDLNNNNSSINTSNTYLKGTEMVFNLNKISNELPEMLPNRKLDNDITKIAALIETAVTRDALPETLNIDSISDVSSDMSVNVNEVKEVNASVSIALDDIEAISAIENAPVSVTLSVNATTENESSISNIVEFPRPNSYSYENNNLENGILQSSQLDEIISYLDTQKTNLPLYNELLTDNIQTESVSESTIQDVETAQENNSDIQEDSSDIQDIQENNSDIQETSFENEQDDIYHTEDYLDKNENSYTENCETQYNNYETEYDNSESAYNNYENHPLSNADDFDYYMHLSIGNDCDSNYVKPSFDLLSKNINSINESANLSKADSDAEKLVDTLKSFGIGASVINISVGPSVTRYELQPDRGVKVSKIVSLADDIALNLAAPSVRIEAPIPGKAAVGIEIPNPEISPVLLRDVIESEEFMNHPSKLSFSVGRDTSGNILIWDIAKMPHLLIAGATGSGKSVCINSLIASIIFKALPSEVKLLLIDPKVVELSIYNGIPHLLTPVLTDPKKASGALNWAITEMNDRYKLFAENGVRDLTNYNNLVKELGVGHTLPQIVIIIDELADLMMVAPKEVEDHICRLAQMARAAGMHIVIATQRPSVDVITGVIKANIPSRISFAVSSQVDSRTILDMGGAEKLMGNGDMLFNPLGMQKPIRVQGCYISDREVDKIVENLKSKSSTAYNSDLAFTIENSTEPQQLETYADDDLLKEAVSVVLDAGQASASLVQRKLRVGYTRAARIIDQMESYGIIAAADGSKPRKILISKQEWFELNS